MRTIKYVCFIFSIAIFNLNFTQSQDYNYFSDIFLLDSLIVWAVEKDGLLWHTTDGGINWNKYQNSIYGYSLLYFTNSNRGWRTAEDKIYYTSNAGIDWSVNFEVDSFVFSDINFLNDSVGFAVGFSPAQTKVFRTTNSGQSWTAVFDSSLGSSLHHINILNEQNIWLMRVNVIYKTTDLGENWETIYYSNVIVGFYFRKLNMFDEYSGILAYNYDSIVAEGKLLSTTNGGYSWNEYSSLIVEFGMTDFYFPLVTTGWVADGSSNILFTTDTGINWDTLQNHQSLSSAIRKFAFIDTLKAWAINSDEILYTTDGWHTFNIMGNITSVEYPDNQILSDFELSQNYPNPFNPSTKIKFTIPQPDSPLQGEARGGLVTLKVYDVLGNEIATLVNEENSPGTYEVEFNIHSDEGRNLSSGVYFYQLRIGGPETSSGQAFIETKKMVLLK